MDFEILPDEIGKSVGHLGPTCANSQFLVCKPTESQNYCKSLNRKSKCCLNFSKKALDHFGPLTRLECGFAAASIRWTYWKENSTFYGVHWSNCLSGCWSCTYICGLLGLYMRVKAWAGPYVHMQKYTEKMVYGGMANGWPSTNCRNKWLVCRT